MGGFVMAVIVFVIVGCTASVLREIYRFARRKLTKEPKTETPQTTPNLFDLHE